jgi:glycosyltransferase involved in cell wall biosynthesis
MKIAYIGTYPPKQCGIGTFTNNLVKAMAMNMGSKKLSANAMVIAVNEMDSNYRYPEEVRLVIYQNQQQDYINAAKFINYSDARVCILQHEFGIFGGDDGIFILPLLHYLEIPLIVTLHTVLKEPSFIQRSIITEIGRKASGIVVMSKRAVEYLINIYKVPFERIALIEHGVPDIDRISRKAAKQKHGLAGRSVLLSFGLISRNKGIETILNALPEVVARHPDVLYILLGATHPNVLRYSGEEYRNYLLRLAKNMGLDKNVYFINEFTNEETLFEYLNACDIYITPYLNEAQITSGSLSYAVGAGCAVVSTPYWHAQELLDNNRGRIFDFGNSTMLAEILNELLDDIVMLENIREKAYSYGKKIRWSGTGREYLQLAENVSRKWEKQKDTYNQPLDIRIMPAFSLDHIRRLTDDTGMVQHAKYSMPNLKEGYCLDDNARALLMSSMAYRRYRDKEITVLMYTYLSFIMYMQNESGNFRNHLNFSRNFLDDDGSEDAFGRTIWALGHLLISPSNDNFRQIARSIFQKAVPVFEKLRTLRGAASTILGLYCYLRNQEDEKMIGSINDLAKLLTEEYYKNCNDDWRWFEGKLTYDNAIIPMALYAAHEATGNNSYLRVAEESASFLESLTMKKDFFRPVGNKGWFERGQVIVPDYDQQPIETMAMTLLYYQMYQVSKNTEYLEKMFKCYQWFLGENSLRIPLFDHETKGCCDGLEQTGVNRNQGAESTLAYWISHLTVLDAEEKEHLYFKQFYGAGKEIQK